MTLKALLVLADYNLWVFVYGMCRRLILMVLGAAGKPPSAA